MNRTEKKFLEHVRRQELAGKGDAVLVAVSGGPDSMALLHLFSAVSPVLHCRIGVAHCNFSLRGEESELDETFVKEACSSLGLDCHVRRFDTRKVSVAWKRSIEETARILRYDFFDELRRKHGYTSIATGHHVGDNAETMLFNLFRGTAVSGLRGIRARHGCIVRPLMPLGRKEITEYLVEKEVAWRIDRTNLEIDHDRNFIRNRVIPLIEERFTHKLMPSLQRISEQAAELEEFVERHVDRLVGQHSGLDLTEGKLHIVTMRELTMFERKEILKRVLRMRGLSVDSRVLQRVTDLLERQSGRSVPVGGGFEVVRKEGYLRFRAVPPSADSNPDSPLP
ncbi:MAG: tRNA lysidine(34) synthetase TilS [Chlorobiaceae bacterium]|nr:tRNA lysidine(34) synthetase TilS [Chlorobiaceae bacterium]